MLANLKQRAGSTIGTIVQVLGLSHGVIEGVTYSLSGAGWNALPQRIVYDYSGYDINSGSIDTNQTIKSASIIAVTFLVGKGIKWVAKH